jgi:ATP-dependent helicase/nuclease subunit A
MGLLDDAIREHLDLKRRRGADPSEVARLEHEALGPVRREPAPGEGEPPAPEAAPVEPRAEAPHVDEHHAAADATHVLAPEDRHEPPHGDPLREPTPASEEGPADSADAGPPASPAVPAGGAGEDDFATPLAKSPRPVTGPARSSAPVPALSYTGLAQHARCGYRFYLQRVLRIPPTDETHIGASVRPVTELDPRVRGRLVHSLLEQHDFVRAQPPDDAAVIAEAERAGVRLPAGAAEEIAQLVGGFLASGMRERLASLKDLRREQAFAFQLDTSGGEIPLVGVLDAIGREAQRTVVVDYKSDRLAPGTDPMALAEHDYALQRSAYALAALRDGATEVEVVHCFLERPDEPASATYRSQDLPGLSAELRRRADAVLQREFPVAPDPGPRICDGCPGRGSLCSWPLEATLDVPEGRLF